MVRIVTLNFRFDILVSYKSRIFLQWEATFPSTTRRLDDFVNFKSRVIFISVSVYARPRLPVRPALSTLTVCPRHAVIQAWPPATTPLLGSSPLFPPAASISPPATLLFPPTTRWPTQPRPLLSMSLLSAILYFSLFGKLLMSLLSAIHDSLCNK
jgi:hypothetical protein